MGQNATDIIDDATPLLQIKERLGAWLDEAGEARRRAALCRLSRNVDERTCIALKGVLRNHPERVPSMIEGETLAHIMKADVDQVTRFQLADHLLRSEPELTTILPDVPVSDGNERTWRDELADFFARYSYPGYFNDFLDDHAPSSALRAAARSALTGTDCLETALRHPSAQGAQRSNIKVSADVLFSHFLGMRQKLNYDDWAYDGVDLDPEARTKEVYELVCGYGLPLELDHDQREDLKQATSPLWSQAALNQPVEPFPRTRFAFFFVFARKERSTQLIDLSIKNGDFVAINDEDLRALYQFATGVLMADTQRRQYEPARQKAATFLQAYPHERTEAIDKVLHQPGADLGMVEDLFTRRQRRGLKAQRRAD